MRVRYTAARFQVLPEHFDWELFDPPPLLQSWTRSERLPAIYLPEEMDGTTAFSNNEDSMDDSKTWLSSQAADFLTQEYKTFPGNKRLKSGSDYVGK